MTRPREQATMPDQPTAQTYEVTTTMAQDQPDRFQADATISEPPFLVFTLSGREVYRVATAYLLKSRPVVDETSE